MKSISTLILTKGCGISWLYFQSRESNLAGLHLVIEYLIPHFPNHLTLLLFLLMLKLQKTDIDR